MRTIGLDQSLRNTGVCVLSEVKSVVCLTTIHPKSLREVDRLAYIRDAIRRLVDEHRPVQVAMEGYAQDRPMKAHQLGEVGGVIRLALFDAGIPCVQVAPTALKKFLAGSGLCGKEAMIEAAVRKGVEVGDDHQADAYGLALVAHYVATGERPETRAQYEVLQKLKNPTLRVASRVRKSIGCNL